MFLLLKHHAILLVLTGGLPLGGDAIVNLSASGHNYYFIWSNTLAVMVSEFRVLGPPRRPLRRGGRPVRGQAATPLYNLNNMEAV